MGFWGFGVFTGRSFEQGLLLEVSWKVLFLPINFPSSQVISNYAFGYNETHMGLVLDYGSLLNHHKSPNAKAGEEVPGSNNVFFLVSMDFNILIAML